MFTYGLLLAIFLGSVLVPLSRVVVARLGKKVTMAIGVSIIWVFSLVRPTPGAPAVG